MGRKLKMEERLNVTWLLIALKCKLLLRGECLNYSVGLGALSIIGKCCQALLEWETPSNYMTPKFSTEQHSNCHKWKILNVQEIIS